MYKCVFPNSGDSAYINYSYSDSDMGSIAKIYNLDLYSYGESQNLGVHYQHNLTYKSIRKQIVDFGYDYKKNYGKHMLKYEDTTWATGGYDVEENLLSINYSDMVRNANDAFSYNIGIVHSLDNNQAKCGQYRYGAQDGFNILRAGINYQYRTNSDIIINARLNGQYTTYNLIPSEIINIEFRNAFNCFAGNLNTNIFAMGFNNAVKLFNNDYAFNTSGKILNFINGKRINHTKL